MNSEQTSDGETGGAIPVRRKWPDYGSVWRWHFYAGVFCIPFVIVLSITGMVLWLPRDLRLAGVVYPRLNKPGKTFWKDIHSVGGFWGSGLIVFLIATGLPWSTFWGDYFKWVRTVTGTAVKVQHWEGGHENHSPAATSLNGEEVSKISQLVYAKPKNTKQLDAARNSEQQIPGQISGQSPRAAGGPAWRSAPPDPNSYQLAQITSVAAFADTTAMQSPVLLLPPTAADSVWTVKSETANRPYRQTIRYDAVASRVIDRESFSDQHWVDQVVGQGIALHEGQRFGLINQLIALLATVTLIMLSMTGIILWWRRRDGPGLSPPAMNAAATDKGAITPSRIFMLAVIGIALSIYLPIFGASLVSVLLLDRFVLMRIKPLARWLGLQ